MREFTFSQTQRLARPLEEVFAFFSDPRNLTRITPDWLRFEIRSTGTIDMAVGTRIDYTIRLHGIPLKWQSEITVWDPPSRFVDEQRVGPYRYWIHEHAFQKRNGATEATDRVRYAVPGGALVNRLFVARDVERIFSHRRKVLAAMFGEVDDERKAGGE